MNGNFQKKYKSLVRAYFVDVSDDFFYSHTFDYWVDQIPRNVYKAIEISARGGKEIKVKQMIKTKVEDKSHIPCFTCQETPTIGECVCHKVRFCSQKCMDINWGHGHENICQ